MSFLSENICLAKKRLKQKPKRLHNNNNDNKALVASFSNQNECNCNFYIFQQSGTGINFYWQFFYVIVLLFFREEILIILAISRWQIHLSWMIRVDLSDALYLLTYFNGKFIHWIMKGWLIIISFLFEVLHLFLMWHISNAHNEWI